MKPTLQRATAFALVAFTLLLIADVLLSGVFQGGPPPEHRQRILLLHAAFHGAVLLLSTAGASLGFALLRNHLPTFKQAIVLGLLFGFVSILGASGSLMLAGALGAFAWLFLGSLSFAVGGRLFSRPWHG